MTSANEAPLGLDAANAAPAPEQPVLQLANITAGYGRSTVLRELCPLWIKGVSDIDSSLGAWGRL